MASRMSGGWSVGEWRNCRGCGGLMRVRRYLTMKPGKGQFCSRACVTKDLYVGRNKGKVRVRRSPAGGFKKGRAPWNAGRGEWRNCGVCGKSKWFENNQLRDGRGKFCSKACGYKGRVCTKTFGKKEAHPGWQGGTSRFIYPSRFNPRLKKIIKERDGYMCRLCGITEAQHKEKIGRGLSVNHIDFNKINCDERNLNTLCGGCNTRINWPASRPQWTLYFQEQLEARLGK